MMKLLTAACLFLLSMQVHAQEAEGDTLPADSVGIATDSIGTEGDSTAVNTKHIITVNLENDAVKRFLDEVEYTRDDASRVGEYVPADVSTQRYDHPRPVVIDVPIYNADTLITTHVDTLMTQRVDTLVQTRCDTLFHIKAINQERQYIDTLITITVDTIFTHSYTTTISIARDTLVTIPPDTLRLCYSLEQDYAHGDTILIRNGELREVSIYNLVPQQVYYYKIEVGDSLLAEGEIHTEGRMRMIYVPSIQNVRDMGGFVNDKKQQIRYGLIYRGGELNGQHTADSIDIATLKQLGIEAEIDLRYTGENDGAGISAFGFLDERGVEDDEYPTYLFTENSGCCDESHLRLSYWRQRYRKEFEFIVQCLRLNRPVYYHCIWGSDRTGMLSLMMQGLLGISYSDMVKDMEMSSFSGNTRRKDDKDFIFEYFDTMRGETLQEKIRYYFTVYLGVRSSDIDYFYEQMLTEPAEDVDPGEDNGDEDIPVSIDDEETTENGAGEARRTYNLHGKLTEPNRENGVVIVKEKDGSVSKEVRGKVRGER